ncbi:hypothetical protein RJ639_012101 [Escallonia herrerae]|uniref:Cation/H(+) antiporter 28 n=1 Tax=Escallonia herrerae TaxID=1293975 RepID=A0AA88VMN8_9ASTE|nr:hypothetical protein RJ639_012101 [Escallonia herrerae]
MDSKTPGTDCKKMEMTTKVKTIAVYMLGVLVLMMSSSFFHVLLRPLSQPRIIAESCVGLFFSNLPFIRKALTLDVQRTLSYLSDFIMICHMFIVGLEMDRYTFVRLQIREAKVASAGVLTTFIITYFAMPLLHVSNVPSTKSNLSLSVILSGTASSLLTRLITDLKIGKSDIGKFVVSAGVQSDLISMILISIGFILFDPFDHYNTRKLEKMVIMSSALVVETLAAAKLTPVVMTWVNHENPEGKPMKGSHLVLSIAYVVFICSLSPIAGQFNKVLSAFLAGFVMPREGRMAKMMVSKARYFFTVLFYPIFFFWVGTEAELTKLGAGHIMTWARLFFLFLIVTVGKVAGTLVSGVMLGFHWPESVAIGLLLSIKGHFQVYLAIVAANEGFISISTGIVMVFVTIFTIIYTPLVVAKIIERARKRSPTQRMALQWLSPSNELRIMLCLHGPENVQAAINFMEISRGPAEPGIMVYVTDMIELTDKIAATLAHGEGVDAVTVTDAAVIEMREKITNAVQDHLVENGEGINHRRMLSLSTMNGMHQDLCILAEDLLVSLIILPFHKDQEEDGRLSGGHSGFRNVNRKVLRHAPCSVGILIDRGLGSIETSRSFVSLNAAVIFIGGKDDREALAYSGRVARHPGVKLTVIRFLLDANSDSVSSRVSRSKANTAEHEEEMKLDDEYFAEFYDRHVAGGHVSYMEKYLVNSGQTFSTLRSLEGQYGFFVVGRGGRVNSVLTVGMNDWEECPELGPIGDILLASDISSAASILVIQQHSLKGELHGVHDEFNVM